ncbi:proton channel OtopLc-like isoform X3 [Ostrea edulis]|nr:proton channel OtopLc-like isoform X3 [Ostrea edulis]
MKDKLNHTNTQRKQGVQNGWLMDNDRISRNGSNSFRENESMSSGRVTNCSERETNRCVETDTCNMPVTTLYQQRCSERKLHPNKLFKPTSQEKSSFRGNTDVHERDSFRTAPGVFVRKAEPISKSADSTFYIPETMDTDDAYLIPEKHSLVNIGNHHAHFVIGESLGTTLPPSETVPMVNEEVEEPSVKIKTTPYGFNPELKNSLATILSVMYATLIVVIGSVMSMTESFLQTSRPLSFELFYIFIYSGSICFLLFVYIFLLRKKSGEIINRAVRRLSFHDSQPMVRRVVTFSTIGNTGGFYLRLGAIEIIGLPMKGKSDRRADRDNGFGIGGMILDGLYIAEKFEDYGNPHACQAEVTAATYIVKLVFAFSQLYFVFNNAEMRMLTYQSLAKFGLMHMTATNICEWYRTVVVETLETLTNTVDGHQTLKNSTEDHMYDSTLSTNQTNHTRCMMSKLVGNIIKDTSHYLYPFKIEYNLICAGILYVIWRHLAYNSDIKRMPLIRSESVGDKRRRRLTVDCSSSSKGLFLGILIFVTVVISLKSFYSLLEIDPNSLDGLYVSHLTEIGLYTMAMISTIAAAIRMKDLKFNTWKRAKLEENLIGISQLGLFMYGVFSLVAASTEYNTARGLFTIITNSLMMVQATLQTIFLFTAMRMSAQLEQGDKPGREFVTFLLLCNFCMWVVNTFETIRPEHNVVQIGIYGENAWAIFVHISIPLAIFYRFHSTVCLSQIWKYAWKVKVEDLNQMMPE